MPWTKRATVVELHECDTPRIETAFGRPLANPGDEWTCDQCGSVYRVYKLTNGELFLDCIQGRPPAKPPKGRSGISGRRR